MPLIFIKDTDSIGFDATYSSNNDVICFIQIDFENIGNYAAFSYINIVDDNAAFIQNHIF